MLAVVKAGQSVVLDQSQKVATLVSGLQTAGYHRVEFDGSELASGTYLYVLTTDGFRETKKLTLLK